MHVISVRALRECWERHPKCKSSLKAWFKHAETRNWRTPVELLEDNSNARIIGDSRVIFDIMKNDFRLVIRVEYSRGEIYIRFVGTHAEYDKIDPETI